MRTLSGPVGSMSWDYLAVVRVVIFALLVSTLATNNRRWDWAAVLAIFAFLCVRLTMQVVR